MFSKKNIFYLFSINFEHRKKLKKLNKKLFYFLLVIENN
jgi:hypothetical protein